MPESPSTLSARLFEIPENVTSQSIGIRAGAALVFVPCRGVDPITASDQAGGSSLCGLCAKGRPTRPANGPHCASMRMPADLPIEQPNEIRAGHQPQDRQGDWRDDPAVALAAGGSGDRVTSRRCAQGGGRHSGRHILRGPDHTSEEWPMERGEKRVDGFRFLPPGLRAVSGLSSRKEISWDPSLGHRWPSHCARRRWGWSPARESV